jgi:hypothetical protein
MVACLSNMLPVSGKHISATPGNNPDQTFQQHREETYALDHQDGNVSPIISSWSHPTP